MLQKFIMAFLKNVMLVSFLFTVVFFVQEFPPPAECGVMGSDETVPCKHFFEGEYHG